MDCSLQRSLENFAKTLCAAARWLGIITVDVLLMAGSVSTILVARADCLWTVDSTRAGTPRGLMLHHRLCWKTRRMRSFEHGYVARRVWRYCCARESTPLIVYTYVSLSGTHTSTGPTCKGGVNTLAVKERQGDAAACQAS